MVGDQSGARAVVSKCVFVLLVSFFSSARKVHVGNSSCVFVVGTDQTGEVRRFRSFSELHVSGYTPKS